MSNDIVQPGAPSNLELIREAGATVDCRRQTELAEHLSHLVKRALARNKDLCQAAAEILGDELENLRSDTKGQVGEILPD
ncbi:MAG: hypothetical protein ACI9QC_000804 [Oceanicoccus sp.]|jgi:hypothetical protein